MLPAAIFDLDGLMFDTERLWDEAYRQICARYGYVLDPAFSAESMGVSGKDLAPIVGKYYPNANVDSFWGEALDYVRACVQKEIPVKKGLYEILKMFHANGVKMAVATGTPFEALTEYLHKAGVEGYFEALVSSNAEADPIPSKPAPDIFLKAAAELGFAPEQCYVLEDSYNGVRAAAAAGACTIMIPDLLKPDEEMYRIADAVFESLSEAAEAIERGDI